MPNNHRSAAARPAAANGPDPSGTWYPASVIRVRSRPDDSTRRPSVDRALAKCPRPMAASVSSSTTRTRRRVRGVPPHAPLDFAPAALQPLIRHDGVTDRRRWESALLHQSYATRSSTASRRPTTRNARSIWLM